MKKYLRAFMLFFCPSFLLSFFSFVILLWKEIQSWIFHYYFRNNII